MNQIESNAIQALLNAKSLYPNRERKPLKQREQDLSIWLETYNEVNEVYNLYGLDLVDAPPCNDYLDRGVFRRQRFEANASFSPAGSSLKYDLSPIMRDKKLFQAFVEYTAGSEACCPGIGTITISGFMPARNECASFDEALERLEGSRIVVKPAFGHSGLGVSVYTVHNRCLESNDEAVDAAKFLDNHKSVRESYIIQPYISQHDDLAALNPSSLNTMRIVSYHTGNRVIVDTLASLRFGQRGSDTDNADSGGLFTGINEQGALGNIAFSFTEKSCRRFAEAGKVIPFYEEARNLVGKLHSSIPELFSIGWDIAFGNEGPIVLEANNGWDPYLTQTPNGNAQRRAWNAYLKERMDLLRNG